MRESSVSTIGISQALIPDIEERMVLWVNIAVCFLILLFAEIGYIALAKRANWTTEHNVREDGHPITVVGAGVIFYLSMLLWVALDYFLLTGAPLFSLQLGCFLTGLTLLFITSFIDDIKQLSITIRLAVQCVAVGLLFYALHLSLGISILPLIIGFIFAIGFVNAYNFMDGINGMTAAYSIVVLASFMAVGIYSGYIPILGGGSIVMFTLCALIAAVVFAFFNFRIRALAFCGDVGSICMGFIVLTLLVYLILRLGNLSPLALVSVYAVDAFATILRRMLEGENILKAHRKHIYEQLHFRKGLSQLLISSIYALLQANISALYFYLLANKPGYLSVYTLAVYLLLGAAYICLAVHLGRKKA